MKEQQLPNGTQVRVTTGAAAGYTGRTEVAAIEPQGGVLYKVYLDPGQGAVAAQVGVLWTHREGMKVV